MSIFYIKVFTNNYSLMAHRMQERESEVYDEFFATTEDEYILNVRENPKSKSELINLN